MGVFPLFTLDVGPYFRCMSPKPYFYRILLLIFIGCQCFSLHAQDDLSGQWVGQLVSATNAPPISFSINFTQQVDTITGLAKLEWSSPSKYLEINTGKGVLINKVIDSATKIFQTADITFNLATVQHASGIDDQVIWTTVHFTALIIATNNGFEMRGAWSNGSFYLRKKYSLRQSLLYALSLEIPGWIKPRTLERAAAYKNRMDSVTFQFDTFTTNYFRNFIGSQGVKLQYDSTAEKFTIDPVIANAIMVDVPKDAASCFESSFKKWATDNLRFVWDRSTNTASVQKFAFKLKCDKKTYSIQYPNTPTK